MGAIGIADRQSIVQARSQRGSRHRHEGMAVGGHVHRVPLRDTIEIYRYTLRPLVGRTEIGSRLTSLAERQVEVESRRLNVTPRV